MAHEDVQSLTLEQAVAERAQIHDQINELRERKIALTQHIVAKENEEEQAKSAGFGTTIGLGPEQA